MRGCARGPPHIPLGETGVLCRAPGPYYRTYHQRLIVNVGGIAMNRAHACWYRPRLACQWCRFTQQVLEASPMHAPAYLQSDRPTAVRYRPYHSRAACLLGESARRLASILRTVTWFESRSRSPSETHVTDLQLQLAAAAAVLWFGLASSLGTSIAGQRAQGTQLFRNRGLRRVMPHQSPLPRPGLEAPLHQKPPAPAATFKAQATPL